MFAAFGIYSRLLVLSRLIIGDFSIPRAGIVLVFKDEVISTGQSHVKRPAKPWRPRRLESWQTRKAPALGLATPIGVWTEVTLLGHSRCGRGIAVTLTASALRREGRADDTERGRGSASCHVRVPAARMSREVPPGPSVLTPLQAGNPAGPRRRAQRGLQLPPKVSGNSVLRRVKAMTLVNTCERWSWGDGLAKSVAVGLWSLWSTAELPLSSCAHYLRGKGVFLL